MRTWTQYLVCTLILTGAFFIPNMRWTTAGISQEPLSELSELQQQFAQLKVLHERTLDDLDMVTKRMLLAESQVERNRCRVAVVRLLEQEDHKPPFEHSYFLYDILESLVASHFRSPEVKRILDDDGVEAFPLVLSVLDLESGANQYDVHLYRDRTGRQFYDVGLFQVQIPAWTSDRGEICWYASLGVIPDDGKWHLGQAIQNLKDPWKNADVFGKILRDELLRYKSVRMALTRYNGFYPKGVSGEELRERLGRGDYRWVLRHVEQKYFSAVQKRYSFYVGKTPIKG